MTTGLAAAVGYLKDNRLLPVGFEKQTADKDIAVIGDAPTIRISPPPVTSCATPLSLGSALGPFQVEVELWYQPIGLRWAHNLAWYHAAEPQRFFGYFDSSRRRARSCWHVHSPKTKNYLSEILLASAPVLVQNFPASTHWRLLCVAT